MTLVGTLGTRARAVVSASGGVSFDRLAWTFEWWIGADDRWRVPSRETAVRRSLVGDAPVVRTALRVPGGDAVEYVYGAGVPGVADDVVVVEIENDSPAPFVAAFVVSGARFVSTDGPIVFVDRRPGLVTPRAPSRWAIATGRSTDVEVCGGAARTGDFPSTKDRGARIEAAFLHPVPHRSRLRIALCLGTTAPDVAALSRLPSPDDAGRGWAAQLQRGMRVELADEQLSARIQSARAQVLLAGTAQRPPWEALAALEDWGFDTEAAESWSRLSARGRRRAGVRPGRPATWSEVATLAETAEDAHFLLALRGLFAYEASDDEILLLAHLPEVWRGQNLDVRDVPTHHGPLSYTVRWHGPRAALLWEGPPGVRLRAPGLDPAWSSDEPAGEALLGERAA